MLKNLSFWANRIRLHGRLEWLAVLMAWIIWLLVEVVAFAKKDYERYIDVLGQRALILRSADKLEWAVRLFEKRLRYSLSKWQEQVSLGELAVTRAMIGGTHLGLAIKQANDALNIAKKHAIGDILIRLLNLAYAYDQADNHRNAWLAYDEAMALERDLTYQPSSEYHRVKAWWQAAQYQVHIGMLSNARAFYQTASSLAGKHGFNRHKEEIEKELREINLLP
ncbi:MAG: hypothetical protein ABH814_03320 [bacterium]